MEEEESDGHDALSFPVAPLPRQDAISHMAWSPALHRRPEGISAAWRLPRIAAPLANDGLASTGNREIGPQAAAVGGPARGRQTARRKLRAVAPVGKATTSNAHSQAFAGPGFTAS
jgi:hypothetical protein